MIYKYYTAEVCRERDGKVVVTGSIVGRVLFFLGAQSAYKCMGEDVGDKATLINFRRIK